MSFITKRERVFNEYSDPFDIPARNEGKLKAYSSCTDARAWSHFMSDKTEHLVEIIKRNNEVCRGKYVPMNVIIDMMLSAKNAEISRLKRKIGTLEKMLSSYDQLELSCDQKCEISTAHAMIKAAAESLEELPPLELDMSGYTEGIDSEGFETGKSGGDDGLYTAHSASRVKSVEWAPDSYRGDKTDMKSKSSTSLYKIGSGGSGGMTERPAGMVSGAASTSDLARCVCDASTSAHDQRIDEMQESLISKDAKLNALQNTIAVMENDICEPYCIYAHIYTALEKIYATLSQNDKYRLFLNLMSSGKDTRCLDIKGKILFKLKILEKFSVALLAPCSERFKHDETCECYYADVSLNVEQTFALPTSDVKVPDSNRAHLVADIMDNHEMKEILQKDSCLDRPGKFKPEPEDVLVTDNYNIESENLTRLKNLQINYEDLLNCYENVKRERDNLKLKCQRYDEMEEELERLKALMREYNGLYNERDFYRKRSEDLDSLKEQYLVLADETANLETQLKAEAEINSIKSSTIDELRGDNIDLEKRLNDATIAFEKEKNAILCKLKEAECKIMCQEQQIRSLSAQVDSILGQERSGLRQDLTNYAQERPHTSNFGQERPYRAEDLLDTSYVMEEIDSLKNQIKKLNDALYNSEDEKQQLQKQFEGQLKLINQLRMEIDDWKSSYEKTLQKNDYLENYAEGVREETQRLLAENKRLSQEDDEKSAAVSNLISIINKKSEEINRLTDEIDAKKEENQKLLKQLQDLRNKYANDLKDLQDQKQQFSDSLLQAKRESLELLDKVKDYNELLNTKESYSKSLAEKTESCTELRNKLMDALAQNQKLQSDLSSQEKNNAGLLQEIKKLREVNSYAAGNLNSLENEKEQYRQSYELQRKESKHLEEKLKDLEDLQNQLQSLKLANDKLNNDKAKLEKELQEKNQSLEEAMTSIELTEKKSKSLLDMLENSENLKEDMVKLSNNYKKLSYDKQILQKKLEDKTKELDDLAKALDNLKLENERLLKDCQKNKDLEKELAELKQNYNDLFDEKSMLQKDFDTKTQELNSLCNTLDSKIEENGDLLRKIKSLENNQKETKSNLAELQNINTETQSMLNAVRRESEELMGKLKTYESLLKDYEYLKQMNDKLKQEKQSLGDMVHKLEAENKDLHQQGDNIIAQYNKLESELTEARRELIELNSNSPYTNVLNEIEDMKKEKASNHNKIRELLNRLDEADGIISNLTEDVMERNDKIAILENHINSLEDEVRRLHKSLADVVNTGEDLKDNTTKKIDQTLNKIEAHHSKATHNMKMELAKLQNQNAQLEDQLSMTKIKSDESLKDKHKYISQLIHLQNEKEVIVADIKELELSCSGESNLSPDSCNVEEVLKSLDKIRKCIESRQSKTTSLEQTLIKVKTSSQFLISKADETKRLVEKEKQKIINEKEEAIAQKLKMEAELANLKRQLEEQTKHDKDIIKDLEKEILNQNLIINKINDSTKDYISKLEEDLEALQKLYKASLDKIKELQDKIENLSGDNNLKTAMLNKINKEMETKSKEIANLQENLDNVKNKLKLGAQKDTADIKNIKTQTEEKLGDEPNEQNIISDINNMMKVNRPPSPTHKATRYTDKNQAQSINEVQILTAKVEPPSAFTQNKYVELKKKQLGKGELEQYEIKPINAVEQTPLTEFYDNEIRPTQNVLDIFGTQEEIKTDSNNEASYSGTKHHPQQIDNAYSGSSQDDNKTNDLFLIYHDSESSNGEDKSYKTKLGKQPPLYVERVSISNQDKKYAERPTTELLSIESSETVRPTLNIVMPRVEAGYSQDEVTDSSKSGMNIPSKNNRLTKLRLKDTKLAAQRDFPIDPTKSLRTARDKPHENFGLEYILNTVKQELDPDYVRRTQSDSLTSQLKLTENSTISHLFSTHIKGSNQPKASKDKGVMVNVDPSEYYESKIQRLSQQLENSEKDYKKKLEAIKIQYDNNIKAIINDHNQGVNSIQSLHEETLQDILKVHENEVENLRTMSIEAMRKAERLEKDNKLMLTKIQSCNCGCILKEDPIKISSPDLKKQRSRCHGDMRMLTKTNVEAFNVKPKVRSVGPCTCSVDVNVSDTIRSIFEQVDVEQRKLTENAYMKLIANKMLGGNIEVLDSHELSFLHLKVCRTWKSKITKEEALQKKIDSLESKMLNTNRSRQQHLADLDRDLAEQRRRLAMAREAVCRCSPTHSPPPECRPSNALDAEIGDAVPSSIIIPLMPHTSPFASPLSSTYGGNQETCFEVNERRSAGDVMPDVSEPAFRPRCKPESRAVLAKLDVEERRLKKHCDEAPTRLRRSHDRSTRPPRK